MSAYSELLQMYNEEWNGGIILATDNALEQYQSTIYAFFQGSGEVYIGGIVWSLAKDGKGRWIVRIFKHFIMVSKSCLLSFYADVIYVSYVIRHVFTDKLG